MDRAEGRAEVAIVLLDGAVALDDPDLAGTLISLSNLGSDQDGRWQPGRQRCRL
jgi:hypothetical protein